MNELEKLKSEVYDLLRSREIISQMIVRKNQEINKLESQQNEKSRLEKIEKK